MRAVVQRVSRAGVRVLNGQAGADSSAEIGPGFVVLLGVALEDDRRQADRLVDKIAGLRVFDDQDGKMNLDLRQAGGSLLVISQFTLLADTRKGRRPSFIGAADPETGRTLYEYAVQGLRDRGFVVRTGTFGTHMLVEIHNDGPVTILLDTDEMKGGPDHLHQSAQPSPPRGS